MRKHLTWTLAATAMCVLLVAAAPSYGSPVRVRAASGATRAVQPTRTVTPFAFKSAIKIFPQSATTVDNCIPFGNNTDFGFTGFIYRSIKAFTVAPGDIIAFDLGGLDDVNVQRNIYFATANKNPKPAQISGNNVISQRIKALAWTQVVSDSQVPKNPQGNTVNGDYELRYTSEAAFAFTGGGFIVGFGSSPPGNYQDFGCEPTVEGTTSSDVSKDFYARFCFKDDQDLGTLDNPGLCSGTAIAIGGIVIRIAAGHGTAVALRGAR